MLALQVRLYHVVSHTTTQVLLTAVHFYLILVMLLAAEVHFEFTRWRPPNLCRIAHPCAYDYLVLI